ncbi:hypothetical protein EVAR_63330_1 [Eumeta japonica]|uniref:Uncharacterized protein n=1 Tax=Eumeta variegata TaxID=151549 RepID=A0A4C1YPR1_EUMVA|nr:hypothetical protein EVAR_63330_1 [Eumeta japonica]
MRENKGLWHNPNKRVAAVKSASALSLRPPAAWGGRSLGGCRNQFAQPQPPSAREPANVVLAGVPPSAYSNAQVFYLDSGVLTNRDGELIYDTLITILDIVSEQSLKQFFFFINSQRGYLIVAEIKRPYCGVTQERLVEFKEIGIRIVRYFTCYRMHDRKQEGRGVSAAGRRAGPGYRRTITLKAYTERS